MEIKINVDDTLEDITVVISGHDIEKMSAIAKQLQNKKKEATKIVIKAADNIHFVKQSDILVVESFGNNLVFTLKNDQQLTTRKTLKQFLQDDHNNLFVQISKSMALNINALSKMEAAFSGNYYAFLVNDARVTVSRRYIKSILNLLEGGLENEFN
ncbi:LytTR family DNA-binding domain-containing protein [Leuconostoc palmae]|uniref:LytTR family DNA-binding domain-containing protein n=1 Tax=Leuconostoc palmae TaxID=501487 RepID=UPI001C7D3D1C|nr:LytTR family DNA-binding domain-containing protein [Leuconostoc palmae]